MALQIDVPTKGGLTAPAAYVRINSASVQKGMMIIGVDVFVDAAAAAEENPVSLVSPTVDRFKIAFDEAAVIGDKTAFQIGYEALKTLPAFVGATDV